MAWDGHIQVQYPYCPDHELDPLGHHTVMGKLGGDVVACHNGLRDPIIVIGLSLVGNF